MFRIFTDHKSLGTLAKVSDNNVRMQRWLEFLTYYTSYTLEYRKGASNGNADFLSRLSIPATEHDRSGSSGLTPADDDEGIYLIPSYGCQQYGVASSPGVGLGGVTSNPEGAVLGGLAPSASDFADFRSHDGPRIRLPDLALHLVSAAPQLDGIDGAPYRLPILSRVHAIIDDPTAASQSARDLYTPYRQRTRSRSAGVRAGGSPASGVSGAAHSGFQHRHLHSQSWARRGRRFCSAPARRLMV